MPRDTTIKATIDIGANITGFQNEINKVRIELSKLSLTDGMKDDFKNLFANLESEIKNIQNKTGNKELSIVDEKSVAKSFDRIGSLWQQLNNRISSSKVQNKLLDADQKSLDKLTKIIKDYNRELNNSESNIGKAAKAVREQAAAAEKLEKDLRKQTELQSLYNDRVSKNRAVEEIQQEINETKKLVQERERIIELAEKEVKTRVQTEEEFKAEYKNKSGTKSGWKAAYDKAQRNGTLPEVKEVQDLTQAYEELAQARKKQEELKTELSNARSDSSNLDKASRAVEDLGKQSESAKTRLKELNDNLAQVKSDAFEKVKDSLLKMTDVPWDKFGIDPESITSFEILEEKIEEIRAKGGAGATETIEKINEALVASRSASEEAVRGFDQASGSIHEMSESAKQLDQMRNNILQFFSIGNAVRLFKRAIRSAMDTVKDLDKVMTETAVVTEFSVGDMWTKLPEYTKRANELGVSIHDVYEASTLYYQQGLKTNEVMAVTNATLRMARIAGLDAAEATDRVTNALRGFNMEINEANADNIADVYSKLAAISASDVDEISVAMTKVASLANSANMQFENTAAFLAQIIETTRESAETAGTALKTVVARFSEVKDLYSKGELLGTDEEGEEIDVNKVSKALRTAGINLNEFLVGQKGLDEIFMELASKWDDLDIVQQRYIATMAAGSRQQSRFIALMSDYRRTQELTAAAQDANGAATEQYNKTLESLETKLTKLKNAWDQFLMSITNSDIIKGAVDMLTGLINALNKVIDTISGGNGLLKSIAAIGISVGGLKLGRSLFNSFFGNPESGIKGYIAQLGMAFRGEKSAITKIGKNVGENLAEGIKDKFGNIKDWLAKKFSSKLSAGQLGLKTVDLSDIDFNLNQNNIQNIFDTALQSVDENILNEQQLKIFKKLEKSAITDAESLAKYTQEAKEAGIQMSITGEQADKLGVTFKNQQQALNITQTAMMGIGSTLLGLGTIIEKVSGQSNGTTKVLKTIGVALMSVGSILPMVANAFKIFGIEVSETIWNIPIIGWIAAIISAIIALITILTEVIETPTEAAERTKATLESASEAANQATEAVNTLRESYEDLAESASKIDELIEGTKEWTEAVRANNQEVLELLNQYKELQIENDNGVLRITNYDAIMTDYQSRENLGNISQIGANINNLREQAFLIEPRSVMDLSVETRDQDGITHLESALTDEQTDTIAVAVAEGLIRNNEQLYQYVKDNFGIEEKLYGGILDFDEIAKQGESLISINAQLDSFGTALGGLALSLTDLDEDAQEYAQNFLDNGSRFSDMYKEERENLKNGLQRQKQSGDANVEEDYKNFLRETYGITSYNTYNGKFDLNGKTKGLADDDVKNAFASWRTANKAAKELESYTKTIAGLEGTVAKAFQGKTGENLKQSDLDSIYEKLNSLTEDNIIQGLKDANIQDLQDANSPLARAIKAYWDSLSPAEQAALGGQEKYGEWAKEFATSIIVAQTSIDNAYNSLNNQNFKDATDQFASSTIDSFAKQLQQYVPADDGAFGVEIIERLGNLIGTDVTEDVEKLEKVVGAFSTVALNSEEDVDSFKETLISLGFDLSGAEQDFDSFIELIKNRAHSLATIDVEKLSEQLPDLVKLANNIRNGEQNRNFSKDDYDKLVEAGVNVSEFTYREDGSYLYIGDKLDNIVTAINNQTNDLLGRGREQSETKAAIFGLTAGLDGKAITRNIYDEYGQIKGTYQDTLTDKEYLNEIIQRATDQDIDLSLLGIDGLSNEMLPQFIAKLSDATAEEWVTAIQDMAARNPQYLKELEKYDDLDEIGLLAEQTLDQLVSNFANTGAEKYKNAILSKASSVIPQDVLENFIGGDFDSLAASQVGRLTKVYSEVSKKGLDPNEVKAYADELIRLGKVQENEIDSAHEIAAQYVIVNTNMKKLIDTSKDWSNLFGENGPLGKGVSFELSSEQFKQFENLKGTLQEIFGVVGELNDEFFQGTEIEGLLTQLVSDNVQEQEAAYSRISELIEITRKQAIIDFVLDPTNATEETLTFREWFQQTLEEFPDLTVEAMWELDQFRDGLNKMINASGEAGKAISANMGLKQSYKQAGVQQIVVPKASKINQLNYGEAWNNINQQITSGTIGVPIYEMTWEPITKDYPKPDFSGLQNYGSRGSGGSKSGSGSGGSGKEEKSNQWLNPYDELYNLQQKINTALRERERLEHRYEDMLKDHTKTASDLVENTLRETASLKQQLALQKQMLAGRQRQVQNVANEKYEDSEGNITTLGAVGATRYASYDLSTNTVQIDYDAIDQIVDENLGKAVEQYVSRLEELQGEIVDTEDAIEEINDQLIEIQDRGKEEYLNFEQKVYDALVARREAEIEALENINSSITDAANKTITAIQDEVAKERQARENTEKEQDIRDKEMRLAYLQRDTSGANDLEILKLQKEISNDQQSYQDMIIDQTIQEMQEEATRAEQQRQAQIDLLKDLLEHEKRYGMFWTDVESKLSGAFDANGKIKVESDLYQLLKEDANFQALSKLKSFQWTEDITKEIAIAIQGLQNYTLAEAKSSSGKLTLNDGTTLTYDAKTGTWYDSKTKKTYTDGDLYWDYNKQAYSLKATNTTQAARPATTTTSTTSATTPAKATTSTPAATTPQQTPKNSEPAKLGRITNTYGWVNVRSSVAYGNNVIGHTEKGQSFDVIGYGDYGWYKIKLPNGQIGYTAVHQNGTPLYSFQAYKQGGLADFTGPAWLDGTKSRPEMVLNAADTQNFIALKDILASILKNTSSTKTAAQTGGDNYFDIDIQAEIDSDYDVDQLAERIKKQIYDAAEYRNVNAISLMR